MRVNAKTDGGKRPRAVMIWESSAKGVSMKLVRKLLGIAAIITAVGFITLSVTGCPAESDDSGSGIAIVPDGSGVNTGEGGTPSGTFAITMQNDGHGTAAASPNPAAQGAEVTITATDNPGYIFDSWQVISGGVTLLHNKANPAKFTMPGNAVTIKATFAEIPPNTPALSLTLPTFDDVEIGYAAQSAKNVTITNKGTGVANITSIALDSAGNTAFTLGGTSITTVAIGGTATFTVQPKIGLAVGTYEGAITVTYDAGKKAEAEVSFTVTNQTFNVTNKTEWDTATAAISGGGNNKTYDIVVTGNFTIAGKGLYYDDGDKYDYTFGTVTGITVNIRGAGTITLDSGSTGSLLYIGENQTVSLRETHLVGHATNNTSLVYLYNNSTFNMTGGTISGNTTTGEGGGVFTNYTGSNTFNMSGGTISGNTSYNGGGVYLYNNSTFNMTGGTISDNTSTATGNNAGGGGVYCNGGTFNMSGTAVIRDNKTNGIGAGVHMFLYADTYFNMTGGTISGNIATGNGGGVGISRNPTSQDGTVYINITGGSITGNTAGNGGGICGMSGNAVGKAIIDLLNLDLVTGNTATRASNPLLGDPANQIYVSSTGGLFLNGVKQEPRKDADYFWN